MGQSCSKALSRGGQEHRACGDTKVSISWGQVSCRPERGVPQGEGSKGLDREPGLWLSGMCPACGLSTSMGLG